jgi:hypothetical protein
MATVTTEQDVRNFDYVRRVIELKQPGSSAALKLAADLVGRELAGPSPMPRHISAGKAREQYGMSVLATGDKPFTDAGHRSVLAGALLTWVSEIRIGGFARDFSTADGERVVVAALTARQFADLAAATRLAGTFAFLERVLAADFSCRGDLHAYQRTIAALLAPWFARRTTADLAAAFAGTSVPWTRLSSSAIREAAGSASGP